MPQLWLDYEELGSFLRVSPVSAERMVTSSGWDRRKSRDGVTRVKLPAQVASEFMMAHALGHTATEAVAALQKVARSEQAGCPIARAA